MATDLPEHVLGRHKGHAVVLCAFEEALAVHADQVLVVPPDIGARNLVGLFPGRASYIHDQSDELFLPDNHPLAELQLAA